MSRTQTPTFTSIKGHIGHNLEVRPVYEEGILMAVDTVCVDCNVRISYQNNVSYQDQQEVLRIRAQRAKALSFDQWLEQIHHPQMIQIHDIDCRCDAGYWECQNQFGPYESTEHSEFYETYVQQLGQGWDASGGTWGEESTPTWGESAPIVPASQAPQIAHQGYHEGGQFRQHTPITPAWETPTDGWET